MPAGAVVSVSPILYNADLCPVWPLRQLSSDPFEHLVAAKAKLRRPSRVVRIQRDGSIFLSHRHAVPRKMGGEVRADEGEQLLSTS